MALALNNLKRVDMPLNKETKPERERYSAINIHMYMKILDNFLILMIENWFGYDEVIFQDDNVSCLRTRGIKAFLPERY